MAKNKNLPDNIEKQFNKALFKQGEPVLFTWLGQKKYGYVKTHKTTNWGIQYTVEANKTRYPCGIQIKGYKTNYSTGCICLEETNSIGANELKKRIETNEQPRGSAEVFRDAPRSNNESKRNDSNKRSSTNKSNRKTKSDTTGTRGVENDIVTSNSGMQSSNTKKRKNSELDMAIKKQRDFLNGFVKKD